MTQATADGAGAAGTSAAGASATGERLPAPLVHVVVAALIGAVAVLAWLFVFMTVNRLLWENPTVEANPWLFPAICLPFSLAVGLLVKYRHAPTTLDGPLTDTLTGGVEAIDWRKLPENILVAWASLFSGAVLGPEGGIGGIAAKLAALYGEKAGVPMAQRRPIVFSTIASAYNGLVASPVFTGVLGSELMPQPAERAALLPSTLLGGVIGYLVFAETGQTGLQDYLHLAPTTSLGPADLVAAILCAFIGLSLGLVTGILLRISGGFFGRFKDREIERALVGGLIFSVAGVAAPILMFSGESQVATVVANPSGYGSAVLVLMALAKLALLAVALRAGFVGGPVFPVIFAAVCVAEALSLLFPGVGFDVLVAATMAGTLMVMFRAPLMVTLLTSVMVGSGPALLALLVLAVVVVMLVQPAIDRTIAARRPGPTTN